MSDKNFNYYDIFKSMVEGSMAASRLLDEVLNNYNGKILNKSMKKMHEIEHSNDNLVHHTLNNLLKDFLPPLEREDITELMESLDNPTDLIEDVLFALYMYNIDEIKPDALKFSNLIVKSIDSLYDGIILFEDFKKNVDEIKKHVIKVNDWEEEGDKLHIESIRNLYVDNKNAKEIIIWTRTYDKLERCLDSIENVADKLESTMMKNT